MEPVTAPTTTPPPSSPPAPIPTPTNTPATVTTTGPTSDGGTSSGVVVKPGATSSEFVVTMLIVVLGAVLSSGLLVSNTAIQIAGIAMATLKAMAYTWSRTSIKNAAGVTMIVVVLFAFHSSGCASADAKMIRATLTTTQAAQAAFVVVNDAKQTACVANAQTKPDGLACLTTWWATASKIDDDLVAVFSAIAAWSLVKDSPHVDTVIKAATNLGTELHAAGVLK